LNSMKNLRSMSEYSKMDENKSKNIGIIPGTLEKTVAGSDDCDNSHTSHVNHLRGYFSGAFKKFVTYFSNLNRRDSHMTQNHLAVDRKSGSKFVPKDSSTRNPPLDCDYSGAGEDLDSPPSKIPKNSFELNSDKTSNTVTNSNLSSNNSHLPNNMGNNNTQIQMENVNINGGVNRNTIPGGTNKSNEGIDENLYSRQLYVLGEDAMKKMANTKILISGMNGVGLEAAKCLILGGMKSVTLHDTKEISNIDVSSNYYIDRTKSMGNNRAEVVFPHLAELNNYVQVKMITSDLTPETISNFDTVLFCPDEFDITFLNRLNYCHENKINCTLALSNGIYGAVFNDFGSDFVVRDPTGNEPEHSFIETIQVESEKNEVIITCLDDRPHHLSSGDFVKFEELKVHKELNNISPIEVEFISRLAFKFKIPDGLKLSEKASETGGIIRQVIMPQTIQFKCFDESLKNVDILPFDFAKPDNPVQIVSFYLAGIDMMSNYSKDAFATQNLDNIKTKSQKFLANTLNSNQF